MWASLNQNTILHLMRSRRGIKQAYFKWINNNIDVWTLNSNASFFDPSVFQNNPELFNMIFPCAVSLFCGNFYAIGLYSAVISILYALQIPVQWHWLEWGGNGESFLKHSVSFSSAQPSKLLAHIISPIVGYRRNWFRTLNQKKLNEKAPKQ